MKGLKTTKRLIAAVLSLVMMLGMLPVIPLSINAAGTSEDVNYVSLPITIRDFAADGMLFETNELGDTGTMGSGVRMDWFDLRAVQGTLKSLLQHHSSCL